MDSPEETGVGPDFAYLCAVARFIYRMERQAPDVAIDKERLLSRCRSEIGKVYARALLGEATTLAIAERAAAIRRLATGSA